MIDILFTPKRIQLFDEKAYSNFPEDLLILMKNSIVQLKLKRNQVLYHEGTMTLGLYIVKRGKLKKYTSGLNEREFIFSLVRENDILGQHALITKDAHAYSVAALEDCVIDFIPFDVFSRIKKHYKFLSEKLLICMTQEVRMFITGCRVLAQHTVRERTAISILKLKEFYKEDINGFCISRRDHSNIVGTSVESLIRVLAEFKTENLITIQDDSSIMIVNEAALRKTANLY